jgi:hypothetical protein
MTNTLVPDSESKPMTDHTVRSTAMLLMYEELARARMSDTIDEAARYRRTQHLLAARRWRRRAERATRRARLAQNAIW